MRLPTVDWRTIAWIFLLGLAVIWAYKYTKLIQGFEDKPVDEEAELSKQVTTAITKVSELLCPIVKEVLIKLQNDLLSEQEQTAGGVEKLAPERKKAVEEGALHQLKMFSMGMTPDKLLVSKDIKGLLFPCPPPSNVYEIPLNIKDYILGTTKACAPTVSDIKQNVAKSRECPPKKEGYEPNIPVYITHTTAEAFEDIAKSEDPAIKQARIAGLKVRLEGIQEAMIHPSFIELTTDYKEVKDIKEQAEKGTLTPNCDI